MKKGLQFLALVFVLIIFGHTTASSIDLEQSIIQPKEVYKKGDTINVNIKLTDVYFSDITSTNWILSDLEVIEYSAWTRISKNVFSMRMTFIITKLTDDQGPYLFLDGINDINKNVNLVVFDFNLDNNIKQRKIANEQK